MRALLTIAMLLAAHVALADPETQIIGRITETATHKPIDGAFVSIERGDTELEVLTDKNGLYHFVVPEGGTYKVTWVYADLKGVGQVAVETGKPATFDGSLDVDSETVIFMLEPKPVVPAKMVKDARRKIAPEYSDAAVLRDVSTRAWLLLDINERGTVTRVKLLNDPGYDLSPIAIKQALRTEFHPARDAGGNPVRSLLVWTIEWPSYWWMAALEGGLSTRIPDNIVFLPCRGSGPMHMGSIHPAYRDCSRPNLSKIGSARWITRP